MARDRLQQRRREEEPRCLRARVRCETRRKIRTDGRYARLLRPIIWTRLKAIDFYPAKPFSSTDNLVARIFGSAVLDAPRREPPRGRSPSLAIFASRPSLLFAGREEDLADLHTTLLGAKGAPVALYGLGGVGKTRLAIEYAWSRETVYSALLFVSANDGAALNAGLAALTTFEILDLPEKEARDDATKITAVLRWLELNPTWLMILDNVDDPAAVAEAAKLMPRLKGGHVDRHRAGVEFSRRISEARISAFLKRARPRNSCSTEPKRTAPRARTTRRWRGRWPGSLAAWRWVWSRRARISRPIASALLAT